jgi:hypothetical protein
MNSFVIEASVAAANGTHLEAVDVAQNPAKRSRKNRKSSKRGKRRFFASTDHLGFPFSRENGLIGSSRSKKSF